jgi:hypothetical protein
LPEGKGIASVGVALKVRHETSQDFCNSEFPKPFDQLLAEVEVVLRGAATQWAPDITQLVKAVEGCDQH